MNSEEKNRLKQQCRRGMLELDLMLNRFLDDEYDDLNAEQQQSFKEFLTIEDPKMFGCLLKSEPADKQFDEIVQLIINKKNDHTD